MSTLRMVLENPRTHEWRIVQILPPLSGGGTKSQKKSQNRYYEETLLDFYFRCNSNGNRWTVWPDGFPDPKYNSITGRSLMHSWLSCTINVKPHVIRNLNGPTRGQYPSFATSAGTEWLRMRKSCSPTQIWLQRARLSWKINSIRFWERSLSSVMFFLMMRVLTPGVASA